MTYCRYQNRESSQCLNDNKSESKCVHFHRQIAVFILGRHVHLCVQNVLCLYIESYISECDVCAVVVAMSSRRKRDLISKKSITSEMRPTNGIIASEWWFTTQVRPPGDHGGPVRSDRVFFFPQKKPVRPGARCPPPVDRDRGPGPYPVCFLDFTKCHHGRQ
jgi:hypothetical protein